VKLLALDTATENCSAALLTDSGIQTLEVETERGHADRILQMIDDLLKQAGATLQDLDAIAFGRGPGSFTGVRLGTTVTQGLAFGAGVGVVPVSDLQAVAQRVLDQDPGSTRILVCNDARMSEVYWACYERAPDGLARLEGEERVSKPGEVQLPPSWSTATAAGRGFLAYTEALRLAVPGVILSAAEGAATTSTAAALPQIAIATLTTATQATAASAPAAATLAAIPTPSANNPLHYLPRATEIARLALPAVRAGQLLAAEQALPRYLRDNVAHVAQPPKSPPEPPRQGS
jgi:tRNA threonylcarbamoyladenosine biosynthesis protein TsaB